jgi:hypothetical protein
MIISAKDYAEVAKERNKRRYGGFKRGIGRRWGFASTSFLTEILAFAKIKEEKKMAYHPTLRGLKSVLWSHYRVLVSAAVPTSVVDKITHITLDRMSRELEDIDKNINTAVQSTIESRPIGENKFD